MHGKEMLIKGINELGLEITDKQLEHFFKYYEVLINTDRVMNLTSIVDLDEVIIKHFIDSLLSFFLSNKPILATTLLFAFINSDIWDFDLYNLVAGSNMVFN